MTMRALALTPEAGSPAPFGKTSAPVHQAKEQKRKAGLPFDVRRRVGNQALLRARAGPLQADAGAPLGLAGLQARLSISEPGDSYEREADSVADRVMRMEAPAVGRGAPPSIRRLSAGDREDIAARHVQRLCDGCEEEEKLQLKADSGCEGSCGGQALRRAEAKVAAVGGGRPLTSEQRAFFEPRFGADFGDVRIHTDSSADAAARAVGARAYTRGSDLVFRQGEYRPDSADGQRLIAHELTHVVQQQGPGTGVQRRVSAEPGGSYIQLQPFPGDGMVPPGDCSWGVYVPLRGAVETAKIIVSGMGACALGDSCVFLATKIAAITAEIGARVALDTTCFRGGDTGHRQQVVDKVNMVIRCWNYFTRLNCPQNLIRAMEAVVERARKVVDAMLYAQLVIALIVLLVVAVILLIKLLIAAGVGGGLVAAAAVLLILLGVLGSEEPPSA